MVYLIVVFTVLSILKFIILSWESNNKNKKARKRFLTELKRK